MPTTTSVNSPVSAITKIDWTNGQGGIASTGGSELEVQVHFTNAVIISGTPQLSLIITNDAGVSHTVQASFKPYTDLSAGSPQSSALFSYTLQPGDTGHYHIDAFNLNGGSIVEQDWAGGLQADLTLNASNRGITANTYLYNAPIFNSLIGTDGNDALGQYFANPAAAPTNGIFTGVDGGGGNLDLLALPVLLPLSVTTQDQARAYTLKYNSASSTVTALAADGTVVATVTVAFPTGVELLVVQKFYKDGAGNYQNANAESLVLSKNLYTTNDAITPNEHFVQGSVGAEAINLATDTSTDARYLVRGGPGADTITGSSGRDAIYGDGGNNLINAGDGNDAIFVGSGNDTVDGGAGSDKIVATLSGQQSGIGARINGFALQSQTGTWDINGFTVSGSTNVYRVLADDAGTLTIKNFSDGSNAMSAANVESLEVRLEQSDSRMNMVLISGDASGNTLNGTGMSIVNGRAGNDTLNASNNGNDVLFGGGGNDTLNGGNSRDLMYGGSGDDSMTGSLGNDWFVGNEGNDTINGGGGTDAAGFLVANTGTSTPLTFSWNASNTQGYVSQGATQLVKITVVADGALQVEDLAAASASYTPFGTDIVTGVEVLNFDFSTGASAPLTVIPPIFGTDFADVLIGSGSNDSIYGLAGNDILVGGAGDDILDGGDGQDLAQYYDATGSVTINLAGGSASGLGVGTDTLISIENASGSRFADTLIGDAKRNTLRGEGGNDTIDGGDGIDTASYAGPKSSYTVTASNGGYIVQGTVGTDGTDFVTQVERLAFADGYQSLVNIPVAGNATLGQTLTAGAGLDSFGALIYQWKADGVAINNATQASYTLTLAEVGKSVTLVASYFDGSSVVGLGESGPSAPVQGLHSVKGVVQDGYIAGAAIYIDANRNGIAEVNENTGAVTDAAGNFNLQSLLAGPIIALGGTNIDTGLANTLQLTAPQGSSVINPITTLIQTYATQQNVSAAVAETAVQTALQIPGTLDLTSYDPLAQNAGDTTALAVQKTLAQVAELGNQAQKLGVDFAAVASALTSSASTGQTLTLSNASQLQTVLVAVATPEVVSTLTTQASLTNTALANATSVQAISSIQTDVAAPFVKTFTPADGAVNAQIADNIVITFNKTIQAGTGVITLKTAGGDTVAAYDVSNSSNLSIQGATLTINPTADLARGTQYVVEFGASSIKDLNGQAYAGADAYNFGTAAGKTVDIQAYSWKTHTLLSEVSVSNSAVAQVSNASGAIHLEAITDPSLTLTASRATPSAETAATNSAVNLQDAIAILKMIVGLPINGANPVSPYQVLAADYDGNGTVGLNDAIGVLKHVVGLQAPEPTWHFLSEADASVAGKATSLTPGIPATTVTADLGTNSAAHIGLVGYLSGDVDGSYAGAANAQDLDVMHPSYFAELVAAHQGLTLAQFGVYS